MQDFHKLLVWQKAHAWVIRIYTLTREFPIEERYGLTSQLRRAASSIPANLAEACGRGGTHEFRRFLQIAMGSASEAEYHVLLARDLGYLSANEYKSIRPAIHEVKRMLASLITTVRRKNRSETGASELNTDD